MIFVALCVHIHAHNNIPNRIENIQEFLRTADTYHTLGLSQIEGIQTYHSRFELLVTNMKKKGYDPLEHRKQDFDVDYMEFKVQLKDFEVHCDFV